ncbi:MAG TPA: glycosyltransferase family 4 protein [Nocardioides sp.]|nr:glycosyltransferase family 4 protein [Nocardioides sp.]
MNDGGKVHVVVPDGIDDPTRPSGGNTYDRRLCDHLAADGWSVSVRAVAGDWPWAGESSRRVLEETLASVRDDELVLVDGLVASAVPEVMLPAARRLRVVLLMHTPFGCRDAGVFGPERAVARAAAAVVTTSEWTRQWVHASYGVDPDRVHVAHPGVYAAEAAVGSDTGRRLLCVGAVTAGKGHDLLLEALTAIADLGWRCVCVGSLTKAPEFVDELFHDIKAAGLDDRIELTGPRTGRELEAAYAAADLFVLASRGETYGMVVAEALARGLPVVAPRGGGIPEALGQTPDGRTPGLLVPPEDAAALAAALARWLTDPSLRGELRQAADERRTGLRRWSETADRVVGVLTEVAR